MDTHFISKNMKNKMQKNIAEFSLYYYCLKPMRIENKIRIVLPSIFREIAQILDNYVFFCRKMKYIRGYVYFLHEA